MKTLFLFVYSLVSSGGRPATQPDRISPISDRFEPTPPQPNEARLTVVQITDVYTLENFASVRTLLQDVRAKSEGAKVISVLTGDFLSPYLLSSVDRGNGMMRALARTPVDYLTFGNHEADINHKTVCKHVRSFPGKFINTNMQDHEAMDAQLPFEIVKISSPDGSQMRKIGLVAVLSDDESLYKHFKAPGAFGGATIRDPWDTLREYEGILKSPPYNCDLIIPLQHLYVPDDYKTCEQFDFPVVLSGHDHHRVDEVVRGTRLLKPGLDAIYATILDISWIDGEDEPKIRARFAKTSDWKPDPAFFKECMSAYDALAPLRNTELARVPPTFEPLSSVNARGRVTTMGRFICSLLRSSLNVQIGRQRAHTVDAVMIMGGNIRAGTDYPPESFFSMEALEAEIKSNEAIGIVSMPGWVLAKSISETHSGDPIPGWMQYDNLIEEEYHDDGSPPVVTHVGGNSIDHEHIYRVATKVSDLTNGQSPTLTKYYEEHPETLPAKGAYVNIHSDLMSYFARNMWRKVWEATESDRGTSEDDVQTRFNKLDLNGDGIIDTEEIHAALRDLVGLSVHAEEKSLAEFVESFSDTNDDGIVTVDDFWAFGQEIPKLYEADKWRLAFARPAKAHMSLVADIVEKLSPVELSDLAVNLY